VFGSLIDDLKEKVDGMLKLAVAGTIAAAAGIVAFMCFAVALFLWMQQTYGTLEAWLALGALFAALAALGLISMLVFRSRTSSRRQKAKTVSARAEDPSMVSRLLQEPAVLLTGLQLLRVVGARRLLPVILLGVVAGGFLMSRNGHTPRHGSDPVERGRGAESGQT
jgi:hypothetical protein